MSAHNGISRRQVLGLAVAGGSVVLFGSVRTVGGFSFPPVVGVSGSGSVILRGLRVSNFARAPKRPMRFTRRRVRSRLRLPDRSLILRAFPARRGLERR